MDGVLIIRKPMKLCVFSNNTFAVDTEILGGGGDIFADVCLFPGLCGFLLAAPGQQQTRCGGWSDPQLTSWREGPTKERPSNNQNPKTYREQR